MTLKPCPRCKKLIPCGKDYCDTCKPIAQAEYEKNREAALAKRKDQNRRPPTRYTAFYRSKVWKQTSKAKLSSCGWKCEAQIDAGCTGTATEVHHIKPIQTPEGWSLRLDWDNLEAVCVHCHNIRHNRYRKRQDILNLHEI